MKKSFFTAIILFFACGQIQAQQAKALTYIEKYKSIAIAEMQRSGVPAAITLAQGMLESGYGESDLCKSSNNHFGIKCKENWTGDKVYHDDDAKNECFRAYPDAAASYKDHSDFLKSREWYAPLFKLSPIDVEGWAYGLKNAGYATEKDYPQRLLKLINDYNLNQYTLVAMQSPKITDITVTNNNSISKINNTTTAPVETAVTPAEDTTNEEEAEIVVLSKSNHQKKQTTNTLKDTTSQQETETVILSVPLVENKSAIKNIAVNYPQGVFTINHTKVMYVHAGTSLIMLAMEHHIDLAKLIEYNELQESDILQKDDLIFLERKQKKGEKDFHVVAVNETLHDICQKEGMRIDYVLAYNNLNKNSQLTVGNKIYLKAQAPITTKANIASVNNSAVKNSL